MVEQGASEPCLPEAVLAMGKPDLRAHFKQLRAGMSDDERARIDAAICDRVLALPAYREAAAILSYLSFGYEVDTRAIIAQAWRDGKQVAVPRVVPGTRAMAWYRICSFEGLEKSALGVEEPPADPVLEVVPASAEAALAIVPGMAFDMQGYRLGYGGGFYDAFLADLDAPSVGLCREAALLDSLPCREEHDLPVRMVVTEAQTLVLP